MTVYVDESRHRFGRMVMCHMVADTLDELHSMADKIGVNRAHFQGAASWPHYDICKSKRAAAVRLGAVQVTGRELARWRLERKRQGLTGHE